MKRLSVILAVVLSLQGCSVAVLSSIWPKPHDPVMFDRIISLQIKVDNLNCADKSNWTQLIDETRHLKVYTEMRKDPQAINIAQLEEATKKAFDSKNEKFCETILKLNKTRIQVIEDAWRGR